MTDNIMVPDSITPVVGWRAWRLTPPTGGLFYTMFSVYGPASSPTKEVMPELALHSTVMKSVWKPGVAMQAVCDAKDKTAGHSASQWHKRHGSEVVQVNGRHILVTQRITREEPRDVPAHKGIVPGDSCKCGIYAAESREKAAVYGTDGIVGRVALWGRVVAHEQGWRGEFAYPQALYLSAERFDKYARPLGKLYGIPVMRFSDIGLKAAPAAEGGTITYKFGSIFEDEPVAS